MTANIMDAMDSTIANSPARRSGAISAAAPRTLQWISAGYTLAFAVC